MGINESNFVRISRDMMRDSYKIHMRWFLAGGTSLNPKKILGSHIAVLEKTVGWPEKKGDAGWCHRG